MKKEEAEKYLAELEAKYAHLSPEEKQIRYEKNLAEMKLRLEKNAKEIISEEMKEKEIVEKLRAIKSLISKRDLKVEKAPVKPRRVKK